MRFRDDERAQSVQIGAILLFAVLILSFSTYQAVVVPEQNGRVEFNHNERVHQQLQDLRNAVVSVTGGTDSQATTVALGTQYPGRAVAVNPPPPSGALQTNGTDDPLVNVSVRNATATGETRDVWNGTVRNYSTGGIAYYPAYNVYEDPPVTRYENSVLVNQFPSANLTLANQTLVDGRRLSVVALDGSFDRSASGTTSVDTRAISASSRTVPVTATDADSPVTLTFASRLPAEEWRTMLGDEPHVESVSGDAGAVPGPFYGITVRLETGVTYRLQLAKVGVGTGATREPASYVTTVAGDGATVRQGESEDLVVEVRDRYNNPVPDVPVVGNVTGSNNGRLETQQVRTDGEGRATFRYRTHASNETGDHRIDFTMNDGADLSKRPFERSTARNASVTVRMEASAGGGSAGPATLAWKAPDETNGNGGASLSSCSAERCTWDVGGSDDGTLDLNATLAPAYESAELDFAVDNSTVGTISSENGATGPNGAGRTTLASRNNGSVSVLAAGAATSTAIDVRVENVTGGSNSGPSIRTRVDDLTDQAQNAPAYVASYALSGVSDSFQRVDVTFVRPDGTTITRSGSGTKAGVELPSTYGAGGEFDVVYEVVYADADGDEYVAASETVTDVADARNPGDNADISASGDASFDSWTISDRTQTNQNRPEFRFNYDVSATGPFSQARLYVLNLPDDGGSDVVDMTTRTVNNEDVRLDSGANDEYRVGILVRDGNGAVVAAANVTDTADGGGEPFTGP